MAGVHEIRELSLETTWCTVLEQVLSYLGVTLNSPVNLVSIGKQIVPINSVQTDIFLNIIVVFLGKDLFGFTDGDMG